MRKQLHLFLYLLPLMSLLPASVLADQTTPLLEVKRDKLMESRFSKTLAALREPEDAKSLQMLQQMAQQFTASMEQLQPLYQQWYQTLSGEEKKELLYRHSDKKWIRLLQELQADAGIQQRLKENRHLRQEHARLQFLCDQAAEF